MKKLAVYDLEILPNALIACIKPVNEPIITYEVSARKNQIEELVNLFENAPYMFVGYNCIHYDGVIMNMLIANKYKFFYGDYLQTAEACFTMSKQIMSRDEADIKQHSKTLSKYRYMNYFGQIDLMTMMASQKLRVGLKPIQVSMCYPNVKEMVIDWTKYIRKDQMDEIIHYCHNDVNSTTELLKLLKGDLQLRISIEKQFGIKCLSKDGVGIGVEIFTKKVCAELGLHSTRELLKFRDNLDVIAVKELLLPEIKFKTSQFQEVLRWYQGMLLNRYGLTGDSKSDEDEKKKTKGKTVMFNKLAHTFGLGGIHSVNKPCIREAGNGWYIIDADVGSMYPSMLLMWMFGPKGFKEAFSRAMQGVYKERMHAKKTGDKLVDKTMKLALNSIIGNLRQEYSAYFAPEANTAICVNGQLFLAMLIEDLELAGIEVIMSNTDGITSMVHETQLEKYYEICTAWEKLSRIELEYVQYEKMVMLAVNDYVAFKAGYNKVKDGVETYVPGFSDMKNKYDFPLPTDAIEYNFAFVKETPDAKLMTEYEKQKGFFLTYPRLGKGLDSLIVPKALINYYGRGIPIEDTIRNFKSIHDYMMFQKVGKQFHVEWNSEEQQHVNRYYASKNKPLLMKWKWQEAKTKKTKLPIVDPKTGKYVMVKGYSNLLAGQGVQLANDLVNITEHDVEFEYYIKQAKAVIERLQPTYTQTTLF